MATQIAQVEKDGFEGKVYQGKNSEFVAWHLATLTTAHGDPVLVTGVTGRNGRPKAAAWNLQQKGTGDFLQRVIRSRVQLSRGQGGSVNVTVPGASIQGVGYDEPLALTLKANIATTKDLSVALEMFAGQINDITARGVFARYDMAEAEAGESAEDEVPEDLGSIHF